MNKDQMIIKELVRKKTQYINMGLFPQTIKDESVKIISEENGYYLGSDNEKYVKAKANPYRQNYTFSNGEKVVKDNEYYFKVEPIIWKILFTKNGETLLMSEYILTSCAYDNDNSCFDNSNLCSYLNSSFINYLDIDRIIEKQNHKIFILSVKDITNSKYNFTSYTNFDYLRAAEVTDYAIANYIYMSEENKNGCYYLNTINSTNSVYYITAYGSINKGYENNIRRKEIGFVPALWIKN